MEYQSLKKLKRMDLLEMLIAQVEENERLLEKMEQLHFQLERQKTLSPRETGASGSAASTQVSSRAMGRPQGFAAGNQGSLSSAAPHAAESPYKSASYASTAQSDPYAPAPYADPYAPAAENATAVKVPQTSQSASYRSSSQSDPYAQAPQADPYAAVSQSAPYAAESPYYASAAQSDPYASKSPYYTLAAKTTPPNSQQETLSQHSCKRENTDPYAPFAPANPKAAAAASPTDPYTLDDQLAPYVAGHEPFVPSRATQLDRTREGLNHPDLLREEKYASQPPTFGEKEGAGMLPSFLQEMPRDEQEDFSRSRVQPGREAPSARSASPYYKQNVVPIKPSQAGTRTENFAPAPSSASVAAGAGTPAARQILSGEYVSSGASAGTSTATPFNAYVRERQGQVRPLPFAAESSYAVGDKVNRSHA